LVGWWETYNVWKFGVKARGEGVLYSFPFVPLGHNGKNNRGNLDLGRAGVLAGKADILGREKMYDINARGMMYDSDVWVLTNTLVFWWFVMAKVIVVCLISWALPFPPERTERRGSPCNSTNRGPN
jgi:hypothetical protein